MTATIVVKGKGNYKGTNETATFRIVQKEISNTAVAAADLFSDKDLGAKATNYKLTVTDDGKKLKKGKDYTVEVLSNTDGVITLELTGMGCYEGTTTTSYRVLKKNQNIAKAKITKNANALAKAFTGDAITLTSSDYSGLVTLNGSTLTFETDYNEVENSYVNNNKKGTAKVTIKGDPTSTGIACGGTKTISFKITAKGAQSNNAGWLIDGSLEGGTKK